MTVEIWSDVVCPFCYIGMKRFQRALAQLPEKERVQVIWRSFQLDPGIKTDPSLNAQQSLAERKGWSAEQTAQAVSHVTRMAAGEGIDYRFDKAVVANTFDAHRFSHFAATHGKQSEAEERLFSAYFSEGKNIADPEVLEEIGASIGLNAEELRRSLDEGAYAQNVREDLQLAREFGISGVPFFVFDRKYAVSGAQESSTFLDVLQKVATS